MYIASLLLSVLTYKSAMQVQLDLLSDFNFVYRSYKSRLLFTKTFNTSTNILLLFLFLSTS